MAMKMPYSVFLATLILCAGSQASLRMRYSVPRTHEYARHYFAIVDSADTSFLDTTIHDTLVDTIIDGSATSVTRYDTLTVERDSTIYVYDRSDTLYRDAATAGSSSGNDEIGNQFYTYLKHIAPGAWNKYDPNAAFDTVACLDAPDSELFVDAQIWMDSLFEPRSGGSYIHNIGALPEDSLVISDAGYIVYLFGGIRFDESGVWSLIAGGDDAGTGFAVDLDRDGAFDSTERSSDKLYFAAPKEGEPERTVIPEQYLPPNYRALDSLRPDYKHKYRLLTEFTAEAGVYYRFFAYYWNHSQVSQSGLFWKRPAGDIEIVPSGAFGERRQYGLPVPSIDSLYVGDQAKESQGWNYVEVPMGETVTFYMSAHNTQGRPYRYIWKFYEGADTVVDSDAGSVALEMDVPDDLMLFVPSLKIEMDGVCKTVRSKEAEETIVLWPKSTAVRAASHARRPFSIAVKGRLLHIANASPRYSEAAVFSISGSEVARAPIAAGAPSTMLSLDQAPAGCYIVRLSGAHAVRTIPLAIY
jgi:hypothetical protein